MILVTLGTQIEPFKRLLDYIENSKLKCKIVVQAGHTKYHSKKMDVFDFISYDEMEKLIKETQEKYARAFIGFREEDGEIRPVSLSNKVL